MSEHVLRVFLLCESTRLMEGYRLNWFTIEKIDEETYAISEYYHWEKFHSYLLIGNEAALLIDTGLGIGDIKKEVSKITNLPVKVITTHVHWDHIGGHASFEDVYVHRGDLKWLKEGLPIPISNIRDDVIRGVDKDIMPKGFNIDEYLIYKGEPSGILEDNDIIDLGGRKVRIIHTPGHSPGHICIFEEEKGYLYSGDLIYKGTLYAFYPSTSPIMFKESINKIRNIKGVNRILPAHNDINIPNNIVERIYVAFKEIEDKNKLSHGGGLFKYKDFQIKV